MHCRRGVAVPRLRGMGDEAKPRRCRVSRTAAVFAAMFLAGCSGAGSVTPSPATPPPVVSVTLAPTATPLLPSRSSPLVAPDWKWQISGHGDFDTSSMWMAAGTYRVDWSTEPAGCALSATLLFVADPDQPGPSLGSSDADGPTRWTTYVHGMAAGWYTAHVTGSCPVWSIILTLP